MDADLTKYKETGEKSEKLGDFIESTLAMEGLDPVGMKQDLKVIGGLDKEWGEGQFLSYMASQDVFMEAPSEENKLVVFTWLMGVGKSCVKKDFNRLRNHFQKPETSYNIIRNYNNAIEAFRKWVVTLKGIEKPEAAPLLKWAEEFILVMAKILPEASRIVKDVHSIHEVTSNFNEIANALDAEFKELDIEAHANLEVKNARVLKRIVFLLGSYKDEHKRALVVRALGGITKQPAIIAVLSETLSSDKSAVVRRATVDALFKVGDSTSCDKLIHALSNDSDVQVRVGAALALAVIGDPRAKEPLAAALEDRDEDVRLAAKAAIENFNTNKQ